MIILTDASSHELGTVLLQVKPDGKEKAVAFASRSLTLTETLYAQVEKEALVLTWEAERFQDFFAGPNGDIPDRSSTFVDALGKVGTGCAPSSYPARPQASDAVQLQNVVCFLQELRDG